MFVDQNITTETWKIARLEITTKPILTLESLSNDVRMSTVMENTVQEAVLEIAEDENAEPEFESTLNCKTGGNWKLDHIAQLPSEMTGSLPFAQSFYKTSTCRVL